MEIAVSLLEGQQLKASFDKHELISDQSIAVGGNEAMPEPFDYFIASMPLCTAFYIRQFCLHRDINTDGIKVSQTTEQIGDDKYKKRFSISIELPDDFPDKYRKALLAAANACTVKKVIQAQPEFEVNIV